LQGLALLLLRLLSGGNQDRDGRIHGIHVTISSVDFEQVKI
jgi:hypothetical protein